MNYGKTQFNVDAVKSLTLSGFKKLYQKQFGDKTENLYYEITGFKKPKAKAKEKKDS